jgi:hypothetical protein
MGEYYMEFLKYQVSFFQHSLIETGPFQTFSFADCDVNLIVRVEQFFQLTDYLFDQKNYPHNMTRQLNFIDQVESLGITC